jgi:hypothetical protein
MAQWRRISAGCGNHVIIAETTPHAKHFGICEMLEFDVEAFIAKLDGMGMKLTAVPLADGKFRVSRWCMMAANDHAQQIQDLWTRQIGDDQGRIDVLAAHLAKQTPDEVTLSISSSLPHVASPDIATESN